MIHRTLASAALLSLLSCTSAFVPFGEDKALGSMQTGQDSSLDSVIYQGEAAEKAKVIEKDRTAVIFLLGSRSFDEVDWEPVEDQLMIGVEWTWLPKKSVVGVEIGTAFSYNQQDMVVSGDLFTFSGSTFEAYAGPRFETALGESPVRVYAGVGPSLIVASFGAEFLGVEVSESDTSIGFYAHAGVLIELGKAYLGVDLRTLTGTSITLFNYEGDADYTQIAFALGFRF